MVSLLYVVYIKQLELAYVISLLYLEYIAVGVGSVISFLTLCIDSS